MTSTTTTPSPLSVFGARKAPAPTARIAIAVDLHDGVVKAKHLKPGQTVRPYVHGVARGAERTVATIEKVGDGSQVRITWSTPHVDEVRAAAYRFFDASLEGTPA